MSNNDKAGSLLAKLRAQSEALRSQGESARRPYEEAIHHIDAQLWRAFRWLEEALRHLDVIRPSIGHHFQLGSVLQVAEPHFERGFVTYRRRAIGGHEVLEHIQVFYQIHGKAPIVVKVNPAAAGQVEERLRAAALPFQYQTEQDENRRIRSGVFTVTPTIAASVRFEPDYRRQIVQVTLHNVDRFESVALDFSPDRLDEVALEDLLSFILGQSNTFLRRAPLAGMQSRTTLAPPLPPPPPQRVAQPSPFTRQAIAARPVSPARPGNAPAPAAPPAPPPAAGPMTKTGPLPAARPMPSARAVLERRLDIHDDATVPDFGLRR
jgi:hypothetical protein